MIPMNKYSPTKYCIEGDYYRLEIYFITKVSFISKFRTYITVSSYHTMNIIKQKVEELYFKKYTQFIEETGKETVKTEDIIIQSNAKFRYWKIAEHSIKEVESIFFLASKNKRKALATESMNLLTNDDAVVTSIFGKLSSANAGLLMLVETATYSKDFIFDERQR